MFDTEFRELALGMRIVGRIHQHAVAQEAGDVFEHVLAFVMLDAAEEPPAHHVFGGLQLQRCRAAHVDRLLVHAPGPEWQPPEAAFQHAHAQSRITIEQTRTDERRGEPHRAPRMRGKAAKEDVVVEIAIAGIVRRGPGKAVVGDRQIVFLRLPPYRIEARVIRGQPLGEQRHHRHRPFGLAPFADFTHRLIDPPCRGDDRALEAVRMRPAELRHVPMIGAYHRDFDRRIVNADQTEPRGRNQEMDVGAFIVHVHDAVLSLVVLRARARSLAAHPPRVPAGKAFARRLLAEDPPVVLGAGAIRVHLASTRPAVRCQFRQPRAKVRIDILVQDLGGGIDVSVGVIDPEAIFHRFSPWLASWPGPALSNGLAPVHAAGTVGASAPVCR